MHALGCWVLLEMGRPFDLGWYKFLSEADVWGLGHSCLTVMRSNVCSFSRDARQCVHAEPAPRHAKFWAQVGLPTHEEVSVVEWM